MPVSVSNSQISLFLTIFCFSKHFRLTCKLQFCSRFATLLSQFKFFLYKWIFSFSTTRRFTVFLISIYSYFNYLFAQRNTYLCMRLIGLCMFCTNSKVLSLFYFILVSFFFFLLPYFTDSFKFLKMFQRLNN